VIPTPSATHWGNYEATTADGRVQALSAVATDPDPSPIGPGVPQALYDSCRLNAPAVREGYLSDGPRKGGNRRGSEPFVEVSWDFALDLVTESLRRVRTRYGDEAIFGGSYGWSSAGRFTTLRARCIGFSRWAGATPIR
jgi:biotin/methionine sulfoxide reductase